MYTSRAGVVKLPIFGGWHLFPSPVGSEVPLEIIRDGKQTTITVRVGRRPHDK
jgi:hypothetical protein